MGWRSGHRSSIPKGMLATDWPIDWPTDWQSQELSKDEIGRYSRHLILPEIGPDGQKKLKASSVLLVGTGGLGSPMALYLAAAGVGRIGLVDFDVVDDSNLQRQVIHGTHEVGQPKLDSAERRIAQINPHVKVEKHEVMLSSQNAMDIIPNYDVVADGTDNFPTRYLVNDACLLAGKPNVYGSIFRFEGQLSVFCMPDGPNYRDLYPEPPPPGLVPSCAEGGVLGVLPGIVGTMQATEVIKLITGIGQPLVGKLLLIDTLAMSFRVMKLHRDPNNPLTGTNPTIKELIDYQQFCGIPQAQSAEEKATMETPAISVSEFKSLRDGGKAPFLLDVRQPYEAEIASIGADQLIPVDELPSRMGELKVDKSSELVVHCRSGGRSAKAVEALRAAGYDKAKNLTGGTLAWSNDIDPDVPKY